MRLSRLRVIGCDTENGAQGVELKKAIVWEGAEKDDKFEDGEKKMLCLRIRSYLEVPKHEA